MLIFLEHCNIQKPLLFSCFFKHVLQTSLQNDPIFDEALTLKHCKVNQKDSREKRAVSGVQNSLLARSNCRTLFPEHQYTQLSPINSLLTCAVITFPSLECTICDILQVHLMGNGGRGDDAYTACQCVLDRARGIDWAENSPLLADCHPLCVYGL